VPDPIHKSVLLREVLSALSPHPGGFYVDTTLGLGGHAAAILAASSPTGRLFGCDRDGDALAEAERRLAAFAGRYELRRGNFADLAEWVSAETADGVLMDLGVSSWQLDRSERGFSFQQDGPLDMRFDDRQPTTASHLVNGLSEVGLAKIFRELGEEPAARRFARAIVQERARRRFETTGQLARLLERLAPRHGQKRHPATRVFQALRMTVNDEIPSLRRALAAACTALKSGGRFAIITFHSGEDRVVKEFGREQTRDYTFEGEVDEPELRQPSLPKMKWVQRKAVQPDAAEVAENPRARSAQLRVLEKL
jgi:16S rRNA (cytosine1402-N4)-methyltransferase